jgi:hypothetical protein
VCYVKKLFNSYVQIGNSTESFRTTCHKKQNALPTQPLAISWQRRDGSGLNTAGSGRDRAFFGLGCLCTKIGLGLLQDVHTQKVSTVGLSEKAQA